MKIHLISDIHLEFGDLPIYNDDGADVLIMAGDICVLKDLKDYKEDCEIVGKRSQVASYVRSFFRRVCTLYPNVVYVMGNHEHYNGCFDESYDIVKNELCSPNPNLHFLEKQTVEIDGHLFIGSTLWTDFNDGDPISMYEAKNRMNDYRIIRLAGESYRSLTPDHTFKEHRESIKFMTKTMDSNPDKPVVIVGHHAPSHKSVKPKYENDIHINGAYRSDLEWIMHNYPQIKLWVHGHTHEEFDYEVHKTRVVCNPRGYVNYERGSQQEDPYFPQSIDI
jgi:Icc-related predicted phosphoesterase